MARKPKFPIIVREQSVIVRIYEEKSVSNKSGFNYRVCWVGSHGVQSLSRANLKKAEAEAHTKARLLANNAAQAPHINNSDVTELLEARALAGEIPLLSALAEWKKARETAGPALLEACEAWKGRRKPAPQRILIKDVIDRFIESKNAAKKQGERTYRSKLKPIVKYFPARFLDSIATVEWDRYLMEFDDAVTRNDIRKRAVSVCRWARKRNFLPPDLELTIEKTERTKETPKPIGIITPETYRELLVFIRGHHPELLAAVVIAGFCGVRSDEIQGKRADGRQRRQLWSDVHLDRGYLAVTAAKENTPSNRVVQICASARQWLRLCPEPQGAVCAPGAIEQFRRLAQEAGFHLPNNCLRHSFISHYVELTGDKFKASTEAGNSVKEIDRCYRKPLPPGEGRKWFGIKPPAGAPKPRRPRGRTG